MTSARQPNTETSGTEPYGPYAKMATTATRGVRVTIVGILVSVVLAAVKIVSGIVGNSYALVADGIESLLDIMSSLVVWGSLVISTRTPTRHHPYGFGKVEPLGGVVVASVLLLAAAGIAFQSVGEILDPGPAPAPFTLVVLVGVVLVKEAMYRLLCRTGTSIGSRAMEADAWHQRSDALTSVAAFIGISIALAAGEGYEAADDWAALFACAIIAVNGVRLFRAALKDVLDVAPEDAAHQQIRKTALAVKGVVAIEKCRVRKSGLGMFVEIHVTVKGDLPVRQGHAIGHRVKDALLASDLRVLDVVAHIEPDDMQEADEIASSAAKAPSP